MKKLFENIGGNTFKIVTEESTRTCFRCGGYGSLKTDKGDEECPTCNGKGKISNDKQEIYKEKSGVDINKIAANLEFKPVTKQKLVYKYVEDGKPSSMPPMTYTKSTTKQPVETITTDGKETQNTAEVGDIIFSGATGENYVIKSAKLPKLYTGNVGSDIYPEQTPRQVALYTGEPVKFKAPWDEDMIIKSGDYLVKDPVNTGYYRIAKVEFEKTYNSI
jgi:hypothetical protein